MLALVLGAYNTYLLNSSTTQTSSSGRFLAPSLKTLEMSEAEIAKLLGSGAPVLGDPNAKVTVVEFADYQCPYCRRYAKDVFPQIKSQFIDKGLARFVYIDFAILGEESLTAAIAAKCAKEQGRFWEYHDYLYENQQGENRGAFSVDKLKSFAKTLNLEQDSFDQCLDSRKYDEAVKEETTLGESFGVKGTPATFINDFFIPGLQGASYYLNRIENALRK